MPYELMIAQLQEALRKEGGKARRLEIEHDLLLILALVDLQNKLTTTNERIDELRTLIEKRYRLEDERGGMGNE